MSDTSFRHVLPDGTAAKRDVGYGANNVPVLNGSPGTPNGSKFLRDDGSWQQAAGTIGPPGIVNPENTDDLGTSGASFTIPETTVATVHTVSVTANTTPTFPAITAGKSFTLVATMQGAFNFTWPATVKWPQGNAPTPSQVAGKKDMWSFLSPDGAVWLGTLAGVDFR